MGPRGVLDAQRRMGPRPAADLRQDDLTLADEQLCGGAHAGSTSRSLGASAWALSRMSTLR